MSRHISHRSPERYRYVSLLAIFIIGAGVAQSAQWLCNMLDNQRVGIRFPADAEIYSSPSHTFRLGAPFSRDKAAGA